MNVHFLAGLSLFLSGFAFSAPLAAGEVDVEAVKVERSGNGAYRFDVTLRHADEGWDHYADRWDVVAPDGAVLGSRVLLHPHDTEQPFTRSLDGVAIPDGIKSVIIRGHDKVHELGGKEMSVELPQN